MKILLTGPTFRLSDLTQKAFHDRIEKAAKRLTVHPNQQEMLCIPLGISLADMTLESVTSSPLLPYLCQELNAPPDTFVQMDQKIEVNDFATSFLESLEWTVRTFPSSEGSPCLRQPDHVTNRLKRWLGWETWPFADWLADRTTEYTPSSMPEGIGRCFRIQEDAALGILTSFIFMVSRELTGCPAQEIMAVATEEDLNEGRWGSQRSS